MLVAVGSTHFQPKSTARHGNACDELTLLVRWQDVLKHLGASEYGSLPVALGQRSPRESYNPDADNFSRVRGSYQNPPEHP